MIIIENQHDLTAYFNTVSERELIPLARAISYRCSLRVLPLIIYEEKKLNPYHLSIFRALALTGIHHKISSAKLHAAAVAANTASDQAASSNAAIVAAAAAAAGDAATADTIAVSAATIAATSIAAAVSAIAADSAAMATDTANAYADYVTAMDDDAIAIAVTAADYAASLPESYRIGGEIWKEILYDLEKGEVELNINNFPLWQHTGKMPKEILEYWQEMRQMAQRQNDEGWWIWTSFYKSALKGDFDFFDNAIDLFNTWKRKDWDRSPKDINHDIIAALSISEPKKSISKAI